MKSLKTFNNLLLTTLLITVVFSLPVHGLSSKDISKKTYESESQEYIKENTYSFEDVDENMYYADAIKKMYEKGYVSGYSKTIFSPESYLTKVQALKIILSIAEIDLTEYNVSNDWALTTLNWVKYNLGIDIPDSNEPATRFDISEYISLIYNLKRINENIPFNDTSNIYALTLYDNKLMKGFYNDENKLIFDGTSFLTRGQACVVFVNLIELEKPRYNKEISDSKFYEYNKNMESTYYNKFLLKPESAETIEDYVYMWEFMIYNNISEYSMIRLSPERTPETLESIKEEIKDSHRIAKRRFVEFIPLLKEFSYQVYFSDSHGNFSKTPTDYIKIIFYIKDTGDEYVEYRNFLYYESIKILNELTETGMLNNDLTDKEKMLVIYEYLANNLEYDYDYINTNAYLALKNNSATCQGYTGLFNYMCHLLNINVGVTGNKNHIWNSFIENDIIYHIDVTWGDTPNTSEINYKWFYKTYEEFPMYESHDIDEYQ